MPANYETTAYLVLRPTYTPWSPKRVNGFTVGGVRKKRPTGKAAAGSIVMALSLKMPAAAFEPLQPEVTIEVPEGAYDLVPEVDVIVPEEG